MSRSKKKFPAGVWCGCKSQKKGKRVASKRFRRYTKILIAQAKYDLLPKRLIHKIVDNSYPNLALVAKYETWMDGTMVRLDEDDNIVNFVPKKAFNYNDIAYP